MAVTTTGIRNPVKSKTVPFSLSVTNAPATRDEMGVREFNEIMQKGLDDAKSGFSRSACDVFADLRKKI